MKKTFAAQQTDLGVGSDTSLGIREEMIFPPNLIPGSDSLSSPECLKYLDLRSYAGESCITSLQTVDLATTLPRPYFHQVHAQASPTTYHFRFIYKPCEVMNESTMKEQIMPPRDSLKVSGDPACMIQAGVLLLPLLAPIDGDHSAAVIFVPTAQPAPDVDEGSKVGEEVTVGGAADSNGDAD